MGTKEYFNGKIIKTGIKHNNLNDCDYNLSYNNFCVILDLKAEEKSSLASKLLSAEASYSDFCCSKSIAAYPCSETAFNGSHCFEVKGTLKPKELALIKIYKTYFED